MALKRNVYLKMKTLSEARQIVADRFIGRSGPGQEQLPVPDAVGRVLAEPVHAAISSPNYHAAAMDGVAVKAENTFGASETHPLELTVNRNAFFVNTGNVLPADTNAVIMIEHVVQMEGDALIIEAPAYPWQHVRKIGEDIVATELLFPRNHLVTPYCIGALLAGGVFRVAVKCRPRVLIIPTGSELIDWQRTKAEELKPGQVLETNSFVLGKLIEDCGGEFVRHSTLVDDAELIKETVRKAVAEDFQMVLILGGSSAGSEDYARQVVTDLGNLLVHGVTIMPGKPVVIGAVSDRPVFGIPGYPVSAIIAFEQFVRPLIAGQLGQIDPPRPTIKVEPTRKIASRLGVEEFVRVKLGQVGERVVASPLPRGAGSITSITEADGIIRIPDHIEGIKDRDSATAELLRPLSAVRRTIVIVGSHDNALDVLADLLKARRSDLTLSSSHVGSMGGLMAVKRGACHLAGSHLLDASDGSYNLSYIRRYLPEVPVKAVNLVLRDQGLIVRKGNPKKISGIEDLARPDVAFINRQGGSGTRILLDYRLKGLGIEPEAINGYRTEEYTHMSVAVAVLSGTVDAGLGIFAAARALGLDFVPVVTEQYDLIIPEIHFGSERIRILLDIIRSKGFRKRVSALGGYHVERTGEVVL
jgi:putative molybdopterin biosynthesis protein